MKIAIALLCLILVAASPAAAQSDSRPRIGLRAGAGTDISGGVAYGGGVNFLMPMANNDLELGIVLFGGDFEEETDEGINTYTENTSVFVFGAMANLLIGYSTASPGPFFVAGVGLASVSVEWEESSPTDTSLGTPLPGGGSKQSEDGSGGGSVFNLGAGMTFANGFDLRAEVPVIVSFAAPGEASSVIPAFLLTGGIRF